jgi:hypothetical protein
MHFDNMIWRVFLKVNKRDKALKIISKIEQTLGHKIDLGTCERYWKDETLYEVDFTIPLNCSNIEQAVFKSLILANKINREWHVIGPYETQTNIWHFEGICSKPNFVGMNWANFIIENDIA